MGRGIYIPSYPTPANGGGMQPGFRTGGFGGAVAPPAPATLVLPITIDFEDETAGQTPSWVDGRNGYKAPYVENISVEGLTKVLRFDQGDGATLGYGAINLALATDQEDGLPLDLSGDLRLQVLEYRGTSARQVYNFSDVSDFTDYTWTERLYLRDSEETNPDYMRVLSTPENGTPDYDTGNVDQTGINNSTGVSWRYSRVEVIKDGTCTFKVYDTSGVQQGTTHQVTWPTSGYYGDNLLHLHGVAGAGFLWRWAQIWIGNTSDAWPSM